MTINTNHYFLDSHTGKGYAEFFNEEIESLDYIYVLKSVPGNGQSTLIKNIVSYFKGKGEALDVIHQAFAADELDGLILKDWNIGIFEGTAPHVLEPQLPFVNGEYVNLNQAVRASDLAYFSDDIRRLKEKCDESYQQFSRALAETFSLHEDLEAFYSGELDIEGANQLATDTIAAIFGDSQLTKQADFKDRFFESSSESNQLDFVEELTKHCATRYFITGRPGSGKSVFMKKIVEASRKRGYDVERYHCGFDPDSLDMIILPELGVAAFDSTPPHDRKPSREGDATIDTAALLKTNPDEDHKQEIADVQASSQKTGDEASEGFRLAKQAYQEMADLYRQAIDFDEVKKMETYIIERIDRRLDKVKHK